MLESAPAPQQEANAHRLQSSPSSFTRKKRLSSLDTLRGLTVFMMVFVDQIGATWPMIDHCPWNGIHLADFVMPYFNFMVGLGVAFSMKKFVQSKHRAPALKKACVRFLKLFFIGMFTQGGIDIADYDMKHIRVMGILQRVAFCYGFAVLVELFIPPKHTPPPSSVPPDINADCKHVQQPQLQPHSEHQQALLPSASNPTQANHEMHISPNASNAETTNLWHTFRVFAVYRYQWLASCCMLLLWIGIMYGVKVPNQYGEICGRGVLTPACNAQGYVDKHVLGVNHMYFPTNGGSYDADDLYSNDVTFQRTKQCSSCSPGKCLKPDAPDWCLHAAFDPEGFVSSITCVLSSMFGMTLLCRSLIFNGNIELQTGLHCGHLLQKYSNDRVRMLHFGIIGSVEVLIGLVLHLSGASVLNTDLYSPSYLVLTAGAATLTLLFLYYVMDRKICVYRSIRDKQQQQRAAADASVLCQCGWNCVDFVIFYPLECVGRNALGIYILAESGIVNWVFEIFYWNTESNSLANVLWPTGVVWGPKDENAAKHPWLYSPVMMLWVLAYCGFWTLCAVFFHRRKMYWVV